MNLANQKNSIFSLLNCTFTQLYKKSQSNIQISSIKYFSVSKFNATSSNIQYK